MKTKILFTVCFAAAAVQLFAQKKYYTTKRYTNLLKEYRIDFTPPARFIELRIDITDDVKSVFHHTIPSSGYMAFLSDDKECLAAYSAPFTSPLIFREKYPSGTTKSEAWAILHRSRFLEDLQRAYGPDARLEDHLTADGGRKAEKQFNVDSVYIYTLPINNEKLKPYTCCTCLLAMRRPCKLVGIYLFLTDEGYKNRKKYISKINRTIRYHRIDKNDPGIKKTLEW